VSSIYVHVPFCARKCLYCDFYSIEDLGAVDAFLEALDREIALARAAARPPVQTVFLGGGTPSLLAPAQIARILDALAGAFALAPDAEVTLEANPGTVTPQTLRAYRTAGVNRLSLGVQSFADEALRALGRIHSAAEARAAIGAARGAGFANLGLDLIYAIPGQTPEAWEATLQEAVGFAPEHLSPYALTIERHTPLGRLVGAGRMRPSPDALEVRMFERTMELLEVHGYEHYEVSNYARPGFHCRHNLVYWRHENYMGFGPAAHSFRLAPDSRSGHRWWNVADLPAYVERLGRGEPPDAGEERLGPAELLAERIFLGLRDGGLDVGDLRRRLGYDLLVERGELIRELLGEGRLERDGDLLRLTRTGYPVCDEIAERLTPGREPRDRVRPA
jgi:oxygen-independent coproporphyrinogen-3 oxidase